MAVQGSGRGADLAFQPIDNWLSIGKRTLFGENRTAEYSGQISLDPTHGLSVYRHVQTTASGGSIAVSDGAFRLRTGTTANGSAQLDSAQRGQYISALTALAGILVFLSRLPTGNEQAEWYYSDASNGFRFGWDAEGPFVRHRRAGTTRSKIRRKDWLDPLDGSGPSGLRWDPTLPAVSRINMNLYGEGPGELNVVLLDADGLAHEIPIYRFVSDNQGVILTEWSQPIGGEVTNGGDTTSLDLFIGGMQFGTLGRGFDVPRTASESRYGASLSGTTIVPLMSFRKKAGQTQANVRVQGFTPISADTVTLLVILDGTLTGASFGGLTNIAAGETKLEVDTAATAISGGNAIYEDSFVGGNGNKLDSPGRVTLGQELPEGQVVTFAARLASGSGGTMDVLTARMEEGF